jgi:hypothetical protein
MNLNWEDIALAFGVLFLVAIFIYIGVVGL